MRKARVAVYAPDSITFTGLTTFLSGRPDFTVVPAAGAGCDVVAVITDEVSSEVLAMLRRWANTVDRATPVVLVTDDLRTDDLLTLVECRVVGLLPRRAATGDRLAQSLLSAAEGNGLMPADLLGELLRKIERLQREVLAPRGLSTSGLTPREVEVLRLMADGKDMNDIAGELTHAEGTVKNVVYALTSRLNLRNRVHAVAYALRMGII